MAILASGGLLAYTIEAVRRRRLQEEYSILWILTASVLLLLSVVRPALNVLAQAMGIYYPPSALFVIGFAFVIMILLHFSMVISRLTRENRELARRFALLVHELEEGGSAPIGRTGEILTMRSQQTHDVHSPQAEYHATPEA